MNGIFQEEALFAPLAFGTMMALAGLLMGRHCRVDAPDGAHLEASGTGWATGRVAAAHGAS